MCIRRRTSNWRSDQSDFAGSARFLESPADRDRVLAMVKRKYAVTTPYLLIARMLAMIGLGKVDFGAFEVSLSG